MSRSPLVLAFAVRVTCIPCLLIPVAAALIAAGAFSGVLGLLGIPGTGRRGGGPDGQQPPPLAPATPRHGLRHQPGRRRNPVD